MQMNIKRQLKALLPIRVELPCATKARVEKYASVSLQRSGQHAIINWFGEQCRDLVHFNHCRFERRWAANWVSPINNRVIQYKGDQIRDSGIQNRAEMTEFISTINCYSRVLHSFEDVDIESRLFSKYIEVSQPVILLILRDPYNWLASSIRHGKSSESLLVSKKAYCIKYLEQALGVNDYLGNNFIDINYNSWVIDASYRKALCKRLGLQFSEVADSSINDIQKFGGGSSFDGMGSESLDFHERIFHRWEKYLSNTFYRSLLDDGYMEDLTKAYFKMENPTKNL